MLHLFIKDLLFFFDAFLRTIYIDRSVLTAEWILHIAGNAEMTFL